MSDAERSDGEVSNEGCGRAPALPAPGAASPSQTEPPPTRALVPVPSPVAHEESHFSGDDAPPFVSRVEGPAEAARAPRDWRRLRAAASLAAVVAIGAAAAVEHVHALRVTAAEQTQTQTLANRLEAMSAKLEALGAGRSRDEVASLRKVLSEIKSSAGNTRDVGGAVGQFASRVDKLEKDEGVRLDRLGDRIDRDAAARLAELSARLDKLEAKAVTPAKAPPKSVVARSDPGVSYEPTGALGRPAPRLRQYWLAAVHNGFAMIESPMGQFAVAPGDVVPGGGGRVLRIERRGREWAVVTTRGQIVAYAD